MGISNRNVVCTNLSGYTVKKCDDLGYHEHYLDMGIGGKAYLSPLQHLGVLTWYKTIMQTGDSADLMIRNETGDQLTWLRIFDTSLHDYDLLKMLCGGYKVEPHELKMCLSDTDTEKPVIYHDTIPSISRAKFEDVTVWLFDPTYVRSAGGIFLKPAMLGQ